MKQQGARLIGDKSVRSKAQAKVTEYLQTSRRLEPIGKDHTSEELIC